MTKTRTGETPFSLTYVSEAVIPAEIGLPSARCQETDQSNNDRALRQNLDLLEERREITAINEARYKQKMEAEYNQKVRTCTFKENEYVIRNNNASRAKKGGKLGPNWEGPYLIHEVKGGGAYSLKQLDGRIIPRTWNALDMRKCYM